MGIGISYKLSLQSASIEQVREKITALRNFVLTLPVAEVDALVELAGDDCHMDKKDDNSPDPYLSLKIRAAEMIGYENKRFIFNNPTHLIGFECLSGRGCTIAAFGLGTLEEIQETNNWVWRIFCKTQYASDPEYGGLDNFVQSHLRMIQILDEAQRLGIHCKVDDDCDYWETRDLQALTAVITSGNFLMAAVMGKISDAIAPLGYKDSQVPIKDYPNFEYLEAEGNEQL